MKAGGRILIGCIAVPILLFGGLLVAWPVYDASTKRAFDHAVSRELPAHASMAQMDAFMRRHTEIYDFTGGQPYGDRDDEFGGRVTQTIVDQLLLDRTVLIHLKVDRRTKRLKRAGVEISYTFL